jgi:hypothetical protein
LGISHNALLRHYKAGRVQRGADGLYDVEDCRIRISAGTNPVMVEAGKMRGSADAGEEAQEPVEQQLLFGVKPAVPSKPAVPQPDSLSEASRRFQWLRVKERELELQVLEGKLVDVGQINSYVGGMIIRARDRLLRIGPELRDRLAQSTDPNTCQELVDTEVFLALSELAEYRPNAA